IKAQGFPFTRGGAPLPGRSPRPPRRRRVPRGPWMSEFGELKPSDKCGIVAIASDEPVAKEIYYGLRILQHRGQESGGIATFDGGETRSKRGMGLVHASEHSHTVDVRRALKEFTRRVGGAYSLAIMIDGVPYAVRDPLASRPLCIGTKDGAYMAASESVVFDTLGYKFVRDLKPGEIVALRPDGIESFRLPH